MARMTAWPHALPDPNIVLNDDPNTLSNYEQFRLYHTVVNFHIDFSNSQLAGHVSLTFQVRRGARSSTVVLDTSYVDILDVKYGGSSPKWELSPRVEPYGSALTIETGSVTQGQVIVLDVFPQATVVVLNA